MKERGDWAAVTGLQGVGMLRTAHALASLVPSSELAGARARATEVPGGSRGQAQPENCQSPSRMPRG